MNRSATITPDERAVIEVAALLDITEFRLFTIAYRRWYGRESEPRIMEGHFANYMFHSVVPPWVRHLTREILEQAKAGTLRAIDYGITESRISRVVLRNGRRLIILLLTACLLLMLATLFYDDLLLITKNCYFPPCY